MNTIELKERQDISSNKELNRVYIQLEELLKELNKKQLPDAVVEQINQTVEEINTTSYTGNELMKLVKQKQTTIVTQVEKQLKITPKKYYKKYWLAVGMSTFGLPIGVVLGLSVGNMAMLAVGLPIGMAIGVAVGSGMDKQASEEGRQLDIEIR